MAKKSNSKNIIVTNLPAAAALILMAAALKLTLEYSFFISLIILIVVYFLLGVTIELVLEKAEAKKKRENLYKEFSEGGRSNLPTGRRELHNELEFEEPVFPVQEETDTPSFERKPLEEETFVADEIEDIPEKESEETLAEEADDVESSEEEEMFIPLDSNSADENFNVAIKSLVDEDGSNENDDLDKFFAGVFGDGGNYSDMKDTEEPFEDEETLDVEPVSDVEETDTEVEAVNEDTELEENQEDIFTLEDIPVDDSIVVPESVEEVAVEAITETEKIQEESETAEVNQELYEALKDVGAIPEEPEDDTPEEEKDARRSLFDGNDFDAERISAGSPSVIFGSVPDTEDDLEYIPPVVEDSGVPKKGKVQVDSQKIDELYAFKKASAGESFFGRRRKE
ncbi:MAG: hypothetical protein E7388_07125 [Ruminococcaceae bacterium]|nr:hypothetical protein [Oscillospiraceae bacterium]